VHPVKVFSDHACFITLQVADEVPGKVGFGHGLDLIDAFLNEVFPEITLPGGVSLADLLEGLFFADREQADVHRVAVGLDCRFTQQITD
jgi:hypothetical protein